MLKDWHETKRDVMRELLNAKVEQCSKFRTTLLKTEGKQIIEATHDMYWASGLPPYLSTTTKPECFSGENWLGHILEGIRDELIRFMPSTSSSSMDISDSAIEPTEEASHSTTAQPPMSTTAQSPPPCRKLLNPRCRPLFNPSCRLLQLLRPPCRLLLNHLC